MRSVSLRLEDLRTTILNLGFMGENEHRQIRIDSKKFYDEYPNAAASLTVCPPCGEVYPAVIERDGDYVVWTITDSDVINEGEGEIQLSFTQEPHVGKTYIGRTRTGRSLVPSGDIPSGIDDFITRAGAALTAIPETIEREISEAMSDNIQTMEELKDAAQDAKEGAEAAQNKAEIAQSAAESAQAGAETAMGAAEAAQSAAESAQTGAESAKTDAESAALSAGTSAQNAAASSQTAAGNASAASTSASNAAGSAQAAAASAQSAAAQVTLVEAAGTAQIALVTAEGATQVAAVGNKGEEVLDSIPSDYSALSGDVSNLKSAIPNLTEIDVLDAEYRQGFLTTNGAYNTSNSGKSYAFDIDGLTESIYLKMSSNNIFRYAFYTKARSEVTSSDTGINYTIVSTSPHEFVFDKSLYGSYKTLIVSTDYNNSNPTTIMAYSGVLKAYMQSEIDDIKDGTGKNIISVLHMEAGNINANTGEGDSSTTRIRSKEFLPPFSGVLSTTNSNGGFYLYAWEGATFKGGWTGNTFGNSAKLNNIDIGAISRAYPSYKFKIVYLIDNGTATVSNVSELRLTNVFYPVTEIPCEKIRVMFNNIGGFNFGTHASGNNRMTTAEALEKMEKYKSFYGEYQPNILSLEEYPMDTSQMSKYIDRGDSVCPETDLYPYIYPNSTTPYQYAVIKTDYTIVSSRNLAISLPDFEYSLRGSMAEIKTPQGRIIGVISTVFDIATQIPNIEDREANREAQMEKCLELLQPYDYALLCVDTNMESQAEFIAMKELFEESGYQLSNGGFYPLTDSCPAAGYKPIDNIFVKGQAKIKAFTVPQVLTTLASDHLPVIADILVY